MQMPAAVFVLVLQVVSGVVSGVPPGPQNQMPPRDRRPAPRTGTAVIRGRVVDGVTGQPLVHVHVRLGGMGSNSSIVTDASGVFSFSRLPSSSYYVFATKPGYLNGTYPEPSRRVRNNRGLEVADGQAMDGVVVPLYRGGAILGRLTDAYGDPADNVTVQVIRAPGSRSLRPGFGSGSTNDVGEFRVGRLEPGTYLVVATPHSGWSGDNSETTALVPTYYPGVLNPEQAEPVTVERGQTMTGLDFQVLEQPVTLVTGTVIDAAGQPASGGNVSAQSMLTSPAGNSMSLRAGGPIRENGAFELKLAPGEYRLVANVNRRDDASKAAPGQVVVTRSVHTDADQQTGSQRLTVGAEPISNVVINVGGGGSISGRLVFDGDAPRPDLERISIGLQPRSFPPTAGAYFDDCRASTRTKPNADMTFTLEGVRGTCVLTVNIMDGRWRVRSALYRGADLLDRPIDLENGQRVRDLQVMVSDRHTEVSADVTDDQSAQLDDYVLLAFSTDKARWSLPRYISFAARSANNPATARSGFGTVGSARVELTPGTGVVPGTLNSGTASVFPLNRPRPGVLTSLPAGDYYVIAIDDAMYEDIRDPAYLEQLVPRATRVTLREGEPQTVQLRRIKAPSSTP